MREQPPSVASKGDGDKLDKPSPPQENIDGDSQEPPPPAPERIAILTPGGPMLIDVFITLDGKPLKEGMDQLIDATLKAAVVADSAEGQATWKALMANDAFLKGQSPNGQLPTQNQRKMWIERYDVNRDGKIARGEAAAWLGRDASQGSRPFDVRSSRSYRPDARAASRLWSLLDGDGDALLTSDELHGAPNSLLALDANDDQLLTLVEMASLQEQLSVSESGAATGRSFSPYAAIHLEPDADLARIEYLLNDLYAPRQDLQPNSFREFAELGTRLDANGDLWLARSELAGLLEIEPHLVLQVDFNPVDARAGKPSASLELTQHSPEITVVAKASPGRLVVRAGSTGVSITAHDFPDAVAEVPSGMAPAVHRNQVRLMVHDQADGVFQELDANGDGRLGAREIATSSHRLISRDANGDGQLRGDELPYLMVVAFLRGEPANERSFYMPPVASVADAPETPAWFRKADFNRDGNISRREFLGRQEKFDELDANRDGFLEPAEFIDAGAPPDASE